jgi:hypothetical protein
VSKDIKVTDKRIFTPEGELREEYRFLDEKSTEADSGEEASSPAASAPAAPAAPAFEPARVAPPRYDQDPGFGPGPGAAYGYEPAASQFDLSGGAPGFNSGLDPGMDPGLDPGMDPGMGSPTFFDLVAMLAEPVAVYLGDVALPDGQDAENLEMARVHIDLLDTLRQKTAGNLNGQESAFLEDLLYRLKVRYVQKRR